MFKKFKFLLCLSLAFICFTNLLSCSLTNDSPKGDYYFCKITVLQSYGQSSDVFDCLESSLANMLSSKGCEDFVIVIKKDCLEVKVPSGKFEKDTLYNDILSVCEYKEITFRAYDNTTLLGVESISTAQAGYDKDGNPMVLLELTKEGQEKFASITEKLSAYEDGKNVLNIYFGETPLSSPKVKDKINSPSVEIIEIETIAEAIFIAETIRVGYYECKIEEFKYIIAEDDSKTESEESAIESKETATESKESLVESEEIIIQEVENLLARVCDFAVFQA